MEGKSSIPFLTAPYDTLREGLGTLKGDVLPTHPVEQIQEQHAKNATATKYQMLRDVYGAALPARMEIESQILSKFHRLPGLPSSKLGLQSMTGALDEIDFESMLGHPDEPDFALPDLHSQMELQLGLNTKPCKRGIF